MIAETSREPCQSQIRPRPGLTERASLRVLRHPYRPRRQWRRLLATGEGRAPPEGPSPSVSCGGTMTDLREGAALACANRQGMVEIVECLWEMAKLQPGDRLKTLRGTTHGVILRRLDDGRVVWRPDGSSAELIGLPETLLRLCLGS